MHILKRLRSMEYIATYLIYELHHRQAVPLGEVSSIKTILTGDKEAVNEILGIDSSICVPVHLYFLEFSYNLSCSEGRFYILKEELAVY